MPADPEVCHAFLCIGIPPPQGKESAAFGKFPPDPVIQFSIDHRRTGKPVDGILLRMQCGMREKGKGEQDAAERFLHDDSFPAMKYDFLYDS